MIFGRSVRAARQARSGQSIVRVAWARLDSFHHLCGTQDVPLDAGGALLPKMTPSPSGNDCRARNFGDGLLDECARLLFFLPFYGEGISARAMKAVHNSSLIENAAK